MGAQLLGSLACDVSRGFHSSLLLQLLPSLQSYTVFCLSCNLDVLDLFKHYCQKGKSVFEYTDSLAKPISGDGIHTINLPPNDWLISLRDDPVFWNQYWFLLLGV